MKDSELDAIQAVTTLSSLLSIFGCGVVLTKLWGNRSSARSLKNRQFAVLCSIDFVTSLFWCVGVAATENNGFCQFQAFIIQWGGLANILWNSAMAYQLYKWIVMKKSEERVYKRSKVYILGIVGSTFLLSICLLAAGTYGDAGMWCWIDDKNEWLRFGFFYFFLLLAWLFNIVVLQQVSATIRSHINDTTQGGLSFAENIIQQKLRQYLAVFVFSWFFGLLNRFVQIVTGETVFATAFLHAFFVPLKGFLNAICYGGLLDEDSVVMACFRQIFPYVMRGSEMELAQRRTSVKAHQQHTDLFTPYAAKQYSIFATSFNQGEAPFSAMGKIDEWIPLGHDVYAIGLQECMCLDELRAAIHAHLGQDEFTIHTCEIGSNNTALGFHGFIALTVFIRTEDIKAGFIKMTEASAGDVANGADLIITTAANKGAVGLPFQIHDTTIGFVCTHLPSDSKGKSKLPKRNGNARSMLKEVVLATEDIGCDLQLQFDHIIIMGDMNYRMNTPAGLMAHTSAASITLNAIANATSIEMKVLNNDPYWFRRKYAMLQGPKSPLFPVEEELAILRSAEAAAAAAWDAVLRNDEMREMMLLGEVFYGFKEPPPRFPPSYKRKKGVVDGDCGDYASYQALVQGYSHTGEENNLDDSTRSESSRNDDRISEMSTISEDTEDDLESNDRMSVTSRESSMVESGSVASKKSRRTSVFDRISISKRASGASPSKAKENSKLRPPSYTDRIIMHSLLDRAENLQSTAYGFCDSIRCSDHRPVCMSLNLEVNGNVLPQRKAKDIKHIDPSTVLLHLSIRNLSAFIMDDSATANPIISADLASLAEMDEEATPAPEPVRRSSSKRLSIQDMISPLAPADTNGIAELTIIFPLPSKDPLFEMRKMYNLAKSFGDSQSLLKSFQGKNKTKLKGSLLKPKTVVPWQEATSTEINLEGCGSLDLGVDVLLKLTDRDGEDLGEGIINLTYMLKEGILGQPNVIETSLSSGGKYKGTLKGEFTLRRHHENIAFC